MGLKMGAITTTAFRLIAATALGLVLLVVPAAARAHHGGAPGGSLAPPGNSAISQYLEVVPTAAGGKPSSNVRHSRSSGAGTSGAGGSGAIPASTRRALVSQGPLGSADAAVAEGTAPSGGSGRTSGPSGSRAGGSTTGGSAEPAAGPAAPSPVNSVLRAMTGSSSSGGLGVLLPLLLGVVFLIGGALALWRRRRAA